MSPVSPISRRALLRSSALGLGGAGALVASACGEAVVEPSSDRDAELLGEALTAEQLVADSYGGSSGAGAQESEQISIFARQAEQHVGAIEDLISEVGGDPADATTDSGEAAGTGPQAAAEALTEAIAVHHRIVSELTSNLRSEVISIMANDAQQLAVLRGLLGEEPVEFAFVTGGSTPPLGEPEYESVPAGGGGGSG